jgi:copper(I)-binding protein
VPHCPLLTRRVALTAAATLLTVGLAGCGSAPDDGTPADTASAVVTLEDGWVKAVDAAGSDSTRMTALFGTLRNPTDDEVTVESASCPAAGRVELHEVVPNDSGEMQMQPKAGGFVIPAGGEHVLQPGGDHIMLMDLRESLDNGTQTTITLSTSIGDVDVTVPVRTFGGGEESYVPEPSPTSS